MKKIRDKLIKKLGRKGFTLVELLAVIVVLAIVMVVAIPNVLNSVTSARAGMLKTSTNTVADWVEKQYALKMFGTIDGAETVDADFNAFCGLYANCTNVATGETGKDLGKNKPTAAQTKAFLKKAGVKPENYTKVEVTIDASGRACVKLTPSETGDFKSKTEAKSNSCA